MRRACCSQRARRLRRGSRRRQPAVRPAACPPRVACCNAQRGSVCAAFFCVERHVEQTDAKLSRRHHSTLFSAPDQVQLLTPLGSLRWAPRRWCPAPAAAGGPSHPRSACTCHTLPMEEAHRWFASAISVLCACAPAGSRMRRRSLPPSSRPVQPPPGFCRQRWGCGAESDAKTMSKTCARTYTAIFQR